MAGVSRCAERLSEVEPCISDIARQEMCSTPMCDGVTVRAKYCSRCYEARRAVTPERRERARRYQRTAAARAAHREACQAYRDAGKVERGICVYCGSETNEVRAKRCLACYRARVLPRAQQKGLKAIHGRLV